MVVGMAHSLLKEKKVLGEFFGEAVSIIVFMLNRSHAK
jgi:hypothetical protein